jgi:hypothetical protein
VVAKASLNFLVQLTNCLGAHILAHLPYLLPPVALQAHSRDPEIRELVTTSLQSIEAGIAENESSHTQDIFIPATASLRKAAAASLAVGEGKIRASSGQNSGTGSNSPGAIALKMIKEKIPTYCSIYT